MYDILKLTLRHTKGYKNERLNWLSNQSKSINIKVDYYQRICSYFGYKQTLINNKLKMAFRGKNAVITGGASGIGLQVARQLLANDAAVSSEDILKWHHYLYQHSPP